MSRNGNRVATGKKAWNLVKDGMLWKRVIDYTSDEFEEEARAFVTQLQESMAPADALQGLLLDRIAAGYLRKQLIFEAEAATRRSSKPKSVQDSSGSTAQPQKSSSLTIIPYRDASNILKYEALLDQAFHRDLILLQKLKEMAPVPDTKDKKSPKDGRALIEASSSV